MLSKQTWQRRFRPSKNLRDVLITSPLPVSRQGKREDDFPGNAEGSVMQIGPLVKTGGLLLCRTLIMDSFEPLGVII